MSTRIAILGASGAVGGTLA